MGAGSQQLARAQMLSEVMDHIVESSKAPPPKRRRGPWVKVSVIVVCAALSAYSWIVKPAWLWGDAVQPPTAREATADARFAIWVLAQRVEAFRATHGALPSRLTDVGDSVPGVHYRRIGAAGFELDATAAGQPVVYTSGESADAFLGSAVDVVRQGGK